MNVALAITLATILCLMFVIWMLYDEYSIMKSDLKRIREYSLQRCEIINSLNANIAEFDRIIIEKDRAIADTNADHNSYVAQKEIVIAGLEDKLETASSAYLAAISEANNKTKLADKLTNEVSMLRSVMAQINMLVNDTKSKSREARVAKETWPAPVSYSVATSSFLQIPDEHGCHFIATNPDSQT